MLNSGLSRPGLRPAYRATHCKPSSGYEWHDPWAVAPQRAHRPPRDPAQRRNINYKTIPQGAATSCYVATNPELEGVTGFYFDDCNMAIPMPTMQDDTKARRLWTISEDLTAGYRLT